MNLGYATLGLNNEKGAVTWKCGGDKINDNLARNLGRMLYIYLFCCISISNRKKT